MFIAGPVVRDSHIEARITVRKTGDPTARSRVRVYTLDGSAKAGKAYEPMTEVSKICSSPKMFFEAEDRRRNWFGLFLLYIHFASCLHALCSRSLRFAFRLCTKALHQDSFFLRLVQHHFAFTLHFDVRSVQRYTHELPRVISACVNYR